MSKELDVVVGVARLDIIGALYAVDHLMAGKKVAFLDCSQYEPKALEYLLKSIQYDIDRLIHLVDFRNTTDELVRQLAEGKLAHDERESKRRVDGICG